MKPDEQIRAILTPKFDGSSLRYPSVPEGYTIREYQRQWTADNGNLPDYLNDFQQAYYFFEQLAAALAQDAAVIYAFHVHVVWPGHKPLSALELLADGLVQVAEQYAVMFTSANGTMGEELSVTLQATALAEIDHASYLPATGDSLLLFAPFGEAQLGALLLERGVQNIPAEFDEGERQRFIAAFLQPPPALLIARVLKQHGIPFRAFALPDVFISLHAALADDALKEYSVQWNHQNVISETVHRAALALGIEPDTLQYGDDNQLMWLLPSSRCEEASKFLGQRFELSAIQAGILLPVSCPPSVEEQS